MKSRSACLRCLWSLFAALASASAIAQSYPSKPIRFVVPLAAGGGTDILARSVGQKLGESWSQPVVVENRPGGGTIIGTELVAKAAPDGYTLSVASPAFSINPSLYKKLPYDNLKDFAAVIQLSSFSNILVVNPALPAKTLTELIALAKSKPGQLNYGSPGNGSSPHLGMELLKSMAGIQMVHVPYKGSAPAMIDLLGGQVSTMFDAVATSLPHVRSGKLRALAVSGSKRSPLLPELPTVAEAGVPGYEANVWIGIVAPTGTPREIINKLNVEIAKILQIPQVKENMLSQGFEPAGGAPEQFGALIKSETAKWGKVVRESGAHVD